MNRKTLPAHLASKSFIKYIRFRKQSWSCWCPHHKIAENYVWWDLIQNGAVWIYCTVLTRRKWTRWTPGTLGWYRHGMIQNIGTCYLIQKKCDHSDDTDNAYTVHTVLHAWHDTDFGGHKRGNSELRNDTENVNTAYVTWYTLQDTLRYVECRIHDIEYIKLSWHLTVELLEMLLDHFNLD
jgi:hypothetical protein